MHIFTYSHLTLAYALTFLYITLSLPFPALAGLEAHIVMPNNAPECKRAAVEGYGGKITFCEPNQAAREKAANDLLQGVPNAVMIPPFDHKDVSVRDV